MIFRTSLTLPAAILCLVLSSCSKSGSKPNTPPTDTTTTTIGTMNINCYIPFDGPQTELIVSEPGGKILLDTIANNSSSPVIAALKTNDTLVDATLVELSGGTTNEVTTYKSINLARLTSLGMNGYMNNYKRLTNFTQSQILYSNIPSQVNLNNFDFFFANYPLNGLLGMQGDQVDHSLEVTFDNYQGNYAYVLFPQEGLYNLHMQQNTVDNVDCSHLDTAVMLTFNRPVPFNSNTAICFLYGILDTTDLSKVISFTDYVQTSTKPGVDFEYAPIPVQKYEMGYYANYSNNDAISYYAYTNNLPQSLPMPQESDLSISNAQADNFSLTFPNTKPTYYQVVLHVDSTIEFEMYLSPDSTTVHPVTFLTNLKSKLLQNARVSSLHLDEFSMWNFNGFNYLNFYGYITNSATVQAHHVTSVASLSRSY